MGAGSEGVRRRQEVRTTVDNQSLPRALCGEQSRVRGCFGLQRPDKQSSRERWT